MRVRHLLLVAGLGAGAVAGPACAQILGIEELPEGGTGGGRDAGPETAEADADAGAWAPGLCECPKTQTWTKAFPVTSDATVAGVAVDTAGRVVLAGSVAGDLTIDGHVLPGGAEHDVFVAVLDSCGEYVWARRFGGGEQRALALAIDPSVGLHAGEIVLTGSYTGSLDFGGATKPLTATIPHAFVARLDPKNGDGIASLGGGSDLAQGTAVVAAPDGSAYWAGTEQDGAILFLRRLDAMLAVANEITPSCDHCDPRVALLSSGAVIAGGFQGSVDFAMGGPGPLNAADLDIYVAPLVPAGSVFTEGKTKAFGAPAAAAAVATDATGGVFLAGAFGGTLNMGGGGKTRTSTGALDAFVARLDATMAPQWLATFGGGGDMDDQQAVAVAIGNQIAVAGDFAGALALDADAGASLQSAGGTDAFLAFLDPASGTVLGAMSFGGAGPDHAAGVALDGQGDAIVAGVLGGPASFECGVVGGGGTSIFVAKRALK